MGVRETFFKYNEPEETLRKIQESTDGQGLDFSEIKYELAHNIIYAAVEFAEEYGFKPVSEFTHVTKYFLEEDSDDIPYIDIHCGNENGKPIYLNINSESPAQSKRILAQLEKTAGRGNYEYYLQGNDDDEEDDEDYIEFEKLMDTYSKYDREELKTLFLSMVDEIKQDSKSLDSKKLEAVVNTVINNAIDDDKVLEYIDILEKDFDVDIVDIFDLPNSFFAGVQYDNVDKLEKTYIKIIRMIDKGNIEKALEKFFKEIGDIPLGYYLRLLYLDMPDEQYKKELDEYYQKYPDYFLFKILWHVHFSDVDDMQASEKIRSLLTEAAGPFTINDLAEFAYHYATHCIVADDFVIEKLIAYEQIIDDRQEIFDSVYNTLLSLIFIIKVTAVRNYCECGKWFVNE
jgi:hypothetical protein